MRAILFTGVTLMVAVDVLAGSAPNRMLVKFDQVDVQTEVDFAVEMVNQDTATRRLLGHTSIVRNIGNSWAELRYSTDVDPQIASKSMMLMAGVSYAQPDYFMYLFPQPALPQMKLGELLDLDILKDPSPITAPRRPDTWSSDPRSGQAWGLAKIKAQAAWNLSKGSEQIVVADIDTGVDYNHEDLAANMWRNPKPTKGDVVGYDFANDDALPFDDQGHGTHTSGTIGAVGGNAIGLSGVSPRTSIMAIKFITAEGSGTTSDAIRSIDYAVANGARVLSNSWGGRGSDEADQENRALYESIERAGKADVLFVAAAGNDGMDIDGTPIYPAGYDLPNILSVASTNDRDARSFFSNFGVRGVDVAAPGSNVLSTIPENRYAEMSGTSMACPHVAGLAALILSVKPDASALEVKEMIMQTVDRLSALEGRIATGGRVNAARALERAALFGVN